MTTIKQNANDFAFTGSKEKPVNKSNVRIVNGGIAQLKGGKHKLKNVYSEGDIKGSGVYSVVMASVPGTELEWDNSDLDDKWITNGAEACFRAMGRARLAIIHRVDFKCRKWKRPDGKKDWWKGALAIRDIDQCIFTECRIVGPMDIGEQENALAPQTVGEVVFDGCGLTHMPRISRPKSAKKKGRSGVKKIIFVGCKKIDEAGKVIGKWPDKTLRPDS